MTLLALIALFLSPEIRQPASATRCGIALSRPSLDLLQDVENRFGKTVRCETHMEFDALGSSQVSADGTPEVILDTYEGRTEENLVHELFHLQLHAKGFPQHLQVKPPPRTNKVLVQQVAEQLGSLIEHRLFYPQMRRMGFDPTRQYREGLENAMSREQPSRVRPPEKRIVDYAEISLLIGDPSLTKRVEDWYVSQGWAKQLRGGKKLTQYLMAFNPDTPGKKRTAVGACLGIVFGRYMPVTWLR